MKKTIFNFFSIDGRIPRKKFNIPYFIVLGLSYAFSGLLYFITRNMDKQISLGKSIDPAEFARFETLLVISAIVIFGGRLLLIPYIIKRLHDLNRSAIYTIIPILLILYLIFIIFYDVPENTMVTLISAAFYWYLILFKGTDGPNQYGDDPLTVENMQKELP